MVHIEKFPNRSIGFISIVALGLITTLIIGIPVENIPAEKSGNATLIEVPAISNLKVSNLGLNSITLNWPTPSDSAEIAIYKIYMDEILIDTVDGSSHTYTITKLKPGNWYNFHVDACNSADKCSIGGPRAGASTLTVQEATEAIIMKVENLTSSGILNSARGESLIRNLAAIYQLDTMNAKTTITQLQVFIDNINSLIADGILPQESGQILIDATNDVIGNLS
jgi:hypothetical protein